MESLGDKETLVIFFQEISTLFSKETEPGDVSANSEREFLSTSSLTALAVSSF